MIFRRSLVSDFTNTAGGVFTVLFSIVLTVGIVRVLSRVAGGTFDAGSILQILLYTSLTYLAPLLALSLFLAVLMSLIRSWQQNEMVVWFSSGGLSLLSWIRPVLHFAIPVVILTGVFALLIAPWARAQIEISKGQFSQRDDTTKVASGQFIETAEGHRIFFIEQVDEENQIVKGIFVAESSKTKDTVVSAKEGKLSVNEDGDRYVDLGEGRRYEIAEKGKSFSITEFDKYGIRLDVKPDQILSVDKTQALPTAALLASPTNKNMGQFLWRVSWPFVALNLALLAIPLSYTNPRAGRSLNLVVAVLVFILYLNSISVMQTWVTEGKWRCWSGLLAVHGTVFAITVLFFIRRVWMQRWLPKQMSLDYWRNR